MLGLLRSSRSFSRRLRPLRLRRRTTLRLEELESRTLLDAYTPAQMRHAYGFDKLSLDGTGQTIAIVDAFANPNVLNDLQVFDAVYGLPDPAFTVATPQGQPRGDVGWGLEIDLDVQWAHAMAPAANILLVEAKSNLLSSMLAAIDYARQQPGVVAVSMSFGTAEFFGETQYDTYFTTPLGHIGGSGLPGGVTFVAASGDRGGQVIWPSASPNVLSIGGTSLALDDLGKVLAEWGWADGGGGPSAFYPEPSYQVPFQISGTRTTPDFAYAADPRYGVSVYDSFGYDSFLQVGGTSAGAPQWAGLIALADQGLALLNIGSLDGPTQTLPALYNLATVSYSTYYNDITDGNNGYPAGPGYDLVTGIGSPYADQVVQGLVLGPQPPPGGNRRPAIPNPLTGAELTRRVLLPVAPPRLEPVAFPGHHGSGTPLNQVASPNDSTSPSAFLLLAATANSTPGVVRAPSGGIVSPSSAQPAGLDRSLIAAAVQPMPTSSSPLPESRVESGGGDNYILPDDRDDNKITALPLVSVPDAWQGAALPAPTPRTGEVAAALVGWRRASDASFAEAGQRGGSWEQEASLATDLERLDLMPDPLVAVGALGILLGGCWGNPSPESHSGGRRRFPDGTVWV